MVLKYWVNVPDLLQFLILREELKGRGYRFLGISAQDKDSEFYDRRILTDAEDAEKVVIAPAFRNMPYHEQMPGVQAYFAMLPEEEEIPDTLPGGFAAPLKSSDHPFQNTSQLEKITKRFPSELLYRLSLDNVPLQKVEHFYFEHPEGYDAFIHAGFDQFRNMMGKPYRLLLRREDIATWCRRESGKMLSLNRLRNKITNPTERNQLESLERILIPNGLVEPSNKAQTVYTLSQPAKEGAYTAVVNRKYMKKI